MENHPDPHGKSAKAEQRWDGGSNCAQSTANTQYRLESETAHQTRTFLKKQNLLFLFKKKILIFLSDTGLKALNNQTPGQYGVISRLLPSSEKEARRWLSFYLGEINEDSVTGVP